MIYVRNHNIVGIFSGSKVVTALYKGSKLIWTKIISCFSKGYWIDKYQWTDNISWVD